MTGFTVADRMVLLAVRGVTIMLTEAEDLDVQGPPNVLRAATPMLKMYKPDFVRELKRLRETMS